MNKVFKVIWNHATQTWTAVSELGHAKGKTKSKKIVKLTALAGAVIGSLAVSQTATAGSDLNNTNESIQLWPKDLAHPTAGRHAIAIGINANASHQDSIAIGQNSQSNWTNSIAIGRDTQSAKDHTVAIGSNATATGYQAVTLGSYSNATDRLTIAVGAKANATKESAIAVGASASATNDNAVALGQTATASNNNAIAIGTKEVTSGNNAVGIGAYAESTAERSTAVGMMSQANGAGSFAGGASAQATGTNSVAIGGATDGTLANKAGTAAKATGAQSIAIGTKSKAIDEDTIAQGNTATANKESDIAIGTSSVANGSSTKPAPKPRKPSKPSNSLPPETPEDTRGVGSAIAMGKTANATGFATIAVGQGANASFDTATAIGLEAKASKEDAIATGSKANASGNFAIATGSGAASSAHGSIATGFNSNASANAAIATGIQSKATAENSVAIGLNSSASINDSVALGSKSVTTAAVNVASATVNGVTYGNFAGSQPKSVVSVGKKGEERQVQNVAAGQINETSTDAVNGSQLYALAQKLGNGNGWNLKTQPNNSPKEAENGESTTTEENIAPDENVTLIAGKNIKLKQTGGDVLIATKDDVIFNTASIGGIKINTGGIQMNDQKITGLKAGEVNSTSKDAVNGSQLYNHPFHFQGFNGNEEGNGDQVSTDYIYRPGVEGNPKLQLVALNGLKMTADSPNTYKLQIDTESDIYKGLKGKDGKDGKDGATGATGATGADGKNAEADVKDNGDGTHTVTIKDGNGNTTTTIVKNGKNGKDGKDGVMTWDIKSTGHTTPASETNAKTIKHTNTVNMEAGKNLTVEQSSNNDSATVKFALDSNVTNLDKVVVNGKDGVDGKDGVTITAPGGKDGNDGLDGKVGISGKDGKDAVSISGKDGVGQIGLTGPKGKDGKDGASINITTDNGKQTLVNREVGADGKPGKTTQRIIYVPTDKDGNPLKDENGNTIKREVATMDDGLIFGGNTGEAHKAALGTQVNVKGADANTDWNKFDAGKNIMTQVNGNTITVGLAKDLEVDNVDVNNNVTAKGTISAPTFKAGDTTIKNGVVTNLTHHIDNPTTVVDDKVLNITDEKKKEAATVRDVLNSGWNLQANGKPVDAVTHGNNVNFASDKGTVTVKANSDGKTSVVNLDVNVDNDTITVNNKGQLVANGTTNFNVATKDGGNKVAKKGGSSTAKITSGKTITYTAGKNIAIEQNGGEILVSTTNDVNHNSVTTNDLTVNKGGNIDMGGNQIHNVKAGTKDTDAVNVSQLKQSIGDVHKRINKVGKEARGGIAGANAAAGLPQVYIPGKSMVAASAGTFKGESAVAVGYSRSSDNGKVIFKLQGNANTQGDVGGSVGVGYQW